MVYTKIKVKWDEIPHKITINYTKNIQRSLIHLINKFIKKELSGNLYLFYNNITACNKLIEYCGLSDVDYHFLCSNTTNKVAHKSTITEINEQPRKITFLTAAGFEGLDILDHHAQALCVIDPSVPNTIFDWETVFQMFGRCRETCREPQIIYNIVNGYRKDIIAPLQIHYESIQRLKSMLETGVLSYEEKCSNKDIVCINGQYIVNPFSEACMLHKKEVFDNMQSLEAIKQYLEKHNVIVELKEISISIPDYKGQSLPFELLCNMVVRGECVTGYKNATLATNAVKTLGLDRLRILKFKVASVKRAIDIAGIKDVMQQIYIIMGLNIGGWYSHTTIANRIKEVNLILNTKYDVNHIIQTLSEMGIVSYSQEKKVDNKRRRGVIIVKLSTENTVNTQPVYNTVAVKPCIHTLKYSLCTKVGRDATWMQQNYFAWIVQQFAEDKSAQTLFSECYNLSLNGYKRLEENFQATDMLVLDVDNGSSIADFNTYMEDFYGNALHYITPTHSSTQEMPKYRVYIPLNHTLCFKPDVEGCVNPHECVSAYKTVKASMFAEYQDPNCQLWYYAPFTDLYQYGDPNVFLNADYIADQIDNVVIATRALNHIGGEQSVISAYDEKSAINTERNNYLYGTKYSANSIIDIINNVQQGNRDNTIFEMVGIRLKKEDIQTVRDGIVDPEKRKMFDDKVKRIFK